MSDISILESVERAAAKAFNTLPGYVPDDQTVPHTLLTEMMTNGMLWVAVNMENIPIGFIGCRNIDGMLYIHETSVTSEHQKQGIGKKLVQQVLNYAQENDYDTIGLTTRRDAVWNMPFYKKMGFEETQDAVLWPGLLKELQSEIKHGADPLIRCAMIKIIPTSQEPQDYRRIHRKG